MQVPASAFHIQAVKSAEPASTTCPLGCHASHSMLSPGPSQTDCGPKGSLKDVSWLARRKTGFQMVPSYR